jgi:WD40 repeat protein
MSRQIAVGKAGEIAVSNRCMVNFYQDGEHIFEWRPSYKYSNEITELIFSPDGSFLVIVTNEILYILDMKTREKVATLNFYKIIKVKFSENSRYIAIGIVASENTHLKTLVIYENINFLPKENKSFFQKTVDYFKPSYLFQEKYSFHVNVNILSLAFSSNEKNIACAHDKNIIIRDIQNLEVITIKEAYSSCLTFSPDDTMFASTSYYHISVYKSKDKDKDFFLLHKIEFYTGDVFCFPICFVCKTIFSSDGKQLITNTIRSHEQDKNYKLDFFSVKSGELLKSEPLDAGHKVFFSENKNLCVTCSDNNIYVKPICNWSDETHYLFPYELKRKVFVLMCIREYGPIKMPMSIWISLFGFIYFRDL